MPFACALIPREHGARRICAERTGAGGAALVAAHRKRARVAIDLDHFERIARAKRTIEHRFHRAATASGTETPSKDSKRIWPYSRNHVNAAAVAREAIEVDLLIMFQVPK